MSEVSKALQVRCAIQGARLLETKAEEMSFAAVVSIAANENHCSDVPNTQQHKRR